MATYVTDYYRLSPWFTECKYMDLTQFAVLILCDDSTACDKMGDYFSTEADKMVNIVYDVE